LKIVMASVALYSVSSTLGKGRHGLLGGSVFLNRRISGMAAFAQSRRTSEGPAIAALPRVQWLRQPSAADSFGRRPLILAEAARDWPIAREAAMPLLLANFANSKVEARVHLPDDGVPYRYADEKHRVEITLSELGRRIADGEPCYAAQIPLQTFTGLDATTDFDALLGPGRRLVSLWIGAQTKSGLHYDLTDNLLVQIDGTKHAILVAPEESRALYPFADSPTKSRVDPERPDLAAFPRLSRATFLTGTLNPGDILFIPRGWWHYLSAPGPSVSMNCWYGQGMSVGEQMMAVTTTNPLMWGPILFDFVRFGALGRPYLRRLLSPPPAGRQLYELVRGRVPRREGDAKR
jgi:hypothetical protein